ncbi:hypothetical protein QX776_01235 [Alteromonadaceae bacterium BrNp21-10]|nr:hypothetical protein [Alteromonadaceae bacterium BrNp21-10]
MNVAEFFEQYQDAFNAKKLEQLIPYYFLPTVFMNADEKLIFMRTEQIEDYLQQVFAEGVEKGVDRISVDVRQVMKLAKNIMFCNVEWHFFDTDGRDFSSSQVSYTLQLEDDSHPKIIAIVRDKEPEFGSI